MDFLSGKVPQRNDLIKVHALPKTLDLGLIRILLLSRQRLEYLNDLLPALLQEPFSLLKGLLRQQKEHQLIRDLYQGLVLKLSGLLRLQG